VRKLAVATAVSATLVLSAAASAADTGARATTFLRAPVVALQGKTFTVVAAPRPDAMCTLRVRYADGTVQLVGRAFARKGRASWSWKVPEVAKPGRATMTVSCGRAGSRSRAITIVGDLVPPRIVIDKQGFSVRAKTSGNSVSFGLLLKNVSPNADALEVYVLVNFVMADGHLIGTHANTVKAIPAATTYAYGGSLSFRGAAPIVQLEVVIKVGGRQRHVVQAPIFDNVRVVPSRNDGQWVGEVDGELINDHPSLNVKGARLSAVVLDGEGNIVGGGTGSANALLPPGTRQAFVMSSGFDSIPFARAASARVSALATYVP
jgi:hypothetical protein